MLIERHGRLLVASAALLVSCGSAQRGPAETVRLEGDEQSSAEVYMPLEDGTVYRYETTSSAGDAPGIFTIQVFRPARERVKLQVGGRTDFLRPRREGIAFETGGYLLKAPLYKGSSFQGSGGTVVVRDFGIGASVPEGKFGDCLRTVEAGGDHVRETVTVYCARVGIVSLETVDLTGVRRVARLKSHGPRVDVLPASPSAPPSP